MDESADQTVEETKMPLSADLPEVTDTSFLYYDLEFGQCPTLDDVSRTTCRDDRSQNLFLGGATNGETVKSALRHSKTDKLSAAVVFSDHNSKFAPSSSFSKHDLSGSLYKLDDLSEDRVLRQAENSNDVGGEVYNFSPETEKHARCKVPNTGCNSGDSSDVATIPREDNSRHGCAGDRSEDVIRPAVLTNANEISNDVNFPTGCDFSDVEDNPQNERNAKEINTAKEPDFPSSEQSMRHLVFKHTELWNEASDCSACVTSSLVSRPASFCDKSLSCSPRSNRAKLEGSKSGVVQPDDASFQESGAGADDRAYDREGRNRVEKFVHLSDSSPCMEQLSPQNFHSSELSQVGNEEKQFVTPHAYFHKSDAKLDEDAEERGEITNEPSAEAVLTVSLPILDVANENVVQELTAAEHQLGLKMRQFPNDSSASIQSHGLKEELRSDFVDQKKDEHSQKLTADPSATSKSESSIDNVDHLLVDSKASELSSADLPEEDVHKHRFESSDLQNVVFGLRCNESPTKSIQDEPPTDPPNYNGSLERKESPILDYSSCAAQSGRQNGEDRSLDSDMNLSSPAGRFVEEDNRNECSLGKAGFLLHDMDQQYGVTYCKDTQGDRIIDNGIKLSQAAQPKDMLLSFGSALSALARKQVPQTFHFELVELPACSQIRNAPEELLTADHTPDTSSLGVTQVGKNASTEDLEHQRAPVPGSPGSTCPTTEAGSNEQSRRSGCDELPVHGSLKEDDLRKHNFPIPTAEIKDGIIRLDAELDLNDSEVMSSPPTVHISSAIACCPIDGKAIQPQAPRIQLSLPTSESGEDFHLKECSINVEDELIASPSVIEGAREHLLSGMADPSGTSESQSLSASVDHLLADFRPTELSSNELEDEHRLESSDHQNVFVGLRYDDSPTPTKGVQGEPATARPSYEGSLERKESPTLERKESPTLDYSSSAVQSGSWSGEHQLPDSETNLSSPAGRFLEEDNRNECSLEGVGFLIHDMEQQYGKTTCKGTENELIMGHGIEVLPAAVHIVPEVQPEYRSLSSGFDLSTSAGKQNHEPFYFELRELLACTYSSKHHSENKKTNQATEYPTQLEVGNSPKELLEANHIPGTSAFGVAQVAKNGSTEVPELEHGSVMGSPGSSCPAAETESNDQPPRSGCDAFPVSAPGKEDDLQEHNFPIPTAEIKEGIIRLDAQQYLNDSEVISIGKEIQPQGRGIQLSLATSEFAEDVHSEECSFNVVSAEIINDCTEEAVRQFTYEEASSQTPASPEFRQDHLHCPDPKANESGITANKTDDKKPHEIGIVSVVNESGFGGKEYETTVPNMKSAGQMEEQSSSDVQSVGGLYSRFCNSDKIGSAANNVRDVDSPAKSAKPIADSTRISVSVQTPSERETENRCVRYSGSSFIRPVVPTQDELYLKTSKSNELPSDVYDMVLQGSDTSSNDDLSVVESIPDSATMYFPSDTIQQHSSEIDVLYLLDSESKLIPPVVQMAEDTLNHTKTINSRVKDLGLYEAQFSVKKDNTCAGVQIDSSTAPDSSMGAGAPKLNSEELLDSERSQSPSIAQLEDELDPRQRYFGETDVNDMKWQDVHASGDEILKAELMADSMSGRLHIPPHPELDCRPPGKEISKELDASLRDVVAEQRVKILDIENCNSEGDATEIQDAFNVGLDKSNRISALELQQSERSVLRNQDGEVPGSEDFGRKPTSRPESDTRVEEPEEEARMFGSDNSNPIAAVKSALQQQLCKESVLGIQDGEAPGDEHLDAKPNEIEEHVSISKSNRSISGLCLEGVESGRQTGTRFRVGMDDPSLQHGDTPVDIVECGLNQRISNQEQNFAVHQSLDRLSTEVVLTVFDIKDRLVEEEHGGSFSQLGVRPHKRMREATSSTDAEQSQGGSDREAIGSCLVCDSENRIPQYSDDRLSAGCRAETSASTTVQGERNVSASPDYEHHRIVPSPSAYAGEEAYSFSMPQSEMECGRTSPAEKTESSVGKYYSGGASRLEELQAPVDFEIQRFASTEAAGPARTRATESTGEEGAMIVAKGTADGKDDRDLTHGCISWDLSEKLKTQQNSNSEAGERKRALDGRSIPKTDNWVSKLRQRLCCGKPATKP